MDHLGIDVHKMESQLCIVGEEGQLSEPRIRTTPVRFAAVLGDRPRARILRTKRSPPFGGLTQSGHAVEMAPC